MIPFFGKQSKDELDATGSRLRAVEWKVNLLLILVGIQLSLSVLSLARATLMPSTTTIVIVSALLIAAGWFFRNQILGLIKRSIARQILQEDSPQRESSFAEREETIH
jgi:hypothetical protein